MYYSKENTDQLDVEYNSSLLENIDQETVGFLGIVGMSGQAVELADWRGMVPNRYKEFIDLFDPKGTVSLWFPLSFE